MSRRRPLFLADGATPPAASLAVDGHGAGCAAVYSHWLDEPEPPGELADDLATGICVAAARDPARWLDPYQHVAIDHLDADGLLAVAVACRPELAREERTARLMVDAAASGDFGEWRGEQAYRLMLRVHQHLRDYRVGGGEDWQQRCLDRFVSGADAILAEASHRDVERDAQVAHVHLVRDHLARGDGYALTIDGDLAAIAWTRRKGHADDFLVTRRDDDLPPHAVDGQVPPRCFQLLSQRVGGDWIHQIDAPRWSWARTIRRPRVAWPDLGAVAIRLTRADSLARWVVPPASKAVGFTCILASVDEDGKATPSRLPPEAIATAWKSR